MSRASEYAERVAALKLRLAETVARLPDYHGGPMTGRVTEEGQCHLDREVVLTPADALALSDWLRFNFREQTSG